MQRVWLDGNLVYEKLDWIFEYTGEHLIDQLKFQNLHGGSSIEKFAPNKLQYMWFDDVAIQEGGCPPDCPPTFEDKTSCGNDNPDETPPTPPTPPPPPPPPPPLAPSPLVKEEDEPGNPGVCVAEYKKCASDDPSERVACLHAMRAQKCVLCSVQAQREGVPNDWDGKILQ